MNYPAERNGGVGKGMDLNTRVLELSRKTLCGIPMRLDPYNPPKEKIDRADQLNCLLSFSLSLSVWCDCSLLRLLLYATT
jgi:hypothetical protein